jgi:SAM-dependent methyltransferase
VILWRGGGGREGRWRPRCQSVSINVIAVNVPYWVGRRCGAAGRAAARPYLGAAKVVLNMQREIRSELLDELPAEDPRAERSRRDLRRVNRWMGNSRIMGRALGAIYPAGPPGTILEIGAGDGTFLLDLARRLPAGGAPVRARLLDRQALVDPATLRDFSRFGWSIQPVQSDVFEYFNAEPESADLILVNLFLHHFHREPLAVLLRSLGAAGRVIVAVEPRRSRVALWCSRLLWGIGCNAVTRHDAVVSVRAGFAGDELSQLWPERPGWRLVERPTGWFSHLFVASRREER